MGTSEISAEISRKLCEIHEINPDQKARTIQPETVMGWPKGTEYQLWEYWQAHYIDPVIEEYRAYMLKLWEEDPLSLYDELCTQS